MNRKYSVIVVVCLLYVFGVFASLCEAKIDPERIIGIWLLDEGEGNVATDASENGYDGAITNSDWVDGQFDGALDINRGGTVTIPFGKAVMIDKVSFILWIRLQILRHSKIISLYGIRATIAMYPIKKFLIHFVVGAITGTLPVE